MKELNVVRSQSSMIVGLIARVVCRKIGYLWPESALVVALVLGTPTAQTFTNNAKTS